MYPVRKEALPAGPASASPPLLSVCPFACLLKEPKAFPLPLGRGSFDPWLPLHGGLQSPQTCSRTGGLWAPTERPLRPLPAPVAETRTAPATALRRPPDGFTSQSRWARACCAFGGARERETGLCREVSPFLRQGSSGGAAQRQGPQTAACALLHPTHSLSSASLSLGALTPVRELG